MSKGYDKEPSGEPGRVLRCEQCEDWIADALDGTLPPSDLAAFTRHLGECALCAQMYKETQQGRAWMEYLAAEPAAPADLLQKILERTSERPELGVSLPAAPALPPRRPARPPVYLLSRQVVRQLVEPRLLMTLAMAFFSIALTLNLTGIHLTQVRAADLEPSRLRATLTRQYYATNEQVTKYYENLRLVYEMEARVRELRRSTELEPTPVSSPKPAKSGPSQPSRDGTGSPSSTVPRSGPLVPQGSHGEGDAGLPAMLVCTLPRGVAVRRFSATVVVSRQPGCAVAPGPRSKAHGQAERSMA